MRARSWVEWMWSSSSMYVYCILFLSLIICTSPVDVDDLLNHVKYCVSVYLASNRQLSEHHRSAQGSRNPQQREGRYVRGRGDYRWMQDLLFRRKGNYCQSFDLVSYPLSITSRMAKQSKGRSVFCLWREWSSSGREFKRSQDCKLRILAWQSCKNFKRVQFCSSTS
jgi:hypothetical protein